MRNHQPIILICYCSLLLSVTLVSCRKLISIPDPSDTITTNQIFRTGTQAETAIAGIYTKMINGASVFQMGSLGTDLFSAGAITIFGGMSSDELFNPTGNSEEAFNAFSTNKLTIYNSGYSGSIWQTGYTAIYGANSVIEGIAASTSALFSDSARKELTGEAKFVRALCYFYLTNLFGDVPMALTVDFNKTASMPRTPQQQVYQQIVLDLKDAASGLAPDYSVGRSERVRPNKWAATALLARVHLFMGDYASAAAAATAVINNTALYNLEADLNNVFLKESREAIWQLKQNTADGTLKNATPEGLALLANPEYTGTARFALTGSLRNAFEPGDKRRTDWVDSTDQSAVSGTSPGLNWYPTKYKTGISNGVVGALANEYYIVLRLAEMYLVRAEAAAHGAVGGISGAIDDLNVIRNRASLPDLPAPLSQAQVIAAIEQERRTELFAEWGHRWLDLKRTGRAHDVLSSLPLKQPWAGDYQLLYPIPSGEIQGNRFLIQNPQY